MMMAFDDNMLLMMLSLFNVCHVCSIRYQGFTMEMGPVLDPEYYASPSFPEERPLPPRLVG